MYFLWKRTRYGTIRISHDGAADLIQNILTACSRGTSARFRLHSLAIADGDNAEMTVVLSSHGDADESAVGHRISSLIEPTGMSVSVVWYSAPSRGCGWLERRFTLYRNPWVWMAAAYSVSLTIIADWSAFFWTSFWGTAAWFTVSGILRVFHSRPFDFQDKYHLEKQSGDREPDM